MNKSIGNVLKNLRLKKGISLNQLAYAYDISKGTLCNIEKGEGYCKFVTVWKIVNALDIKFSDFVNLLEEQLGEDFTLIDE